eukprot:scaffold9658_cov201-Alexandrium_tamarense.AAC.1
MIQCRLLATTKSITCLLAQPLRHQAVYDDSLGVPRCEAHGIECDSVPLLEKRGSSKKTIQIHWAIALA